MEAAIRRQRRPRRKILTDKMVGELPRGPKPHFFPDPELPKHGVRVRSSGPGSYTVITRDPFRKQRWVKVGSVAEMKIAEAREIARTVIRRIEAGLEPFEPPPAKPESVEAVARNWLTRHVEKNKLRTGPEIRRIIVKYILPHWAERNFVDIKRSDVAKLLDHVEDKHGPAMADSVLTVLRSLSSWVHSRDDSYQPIFTKGMLRVPTQARKRSRVLADDELRRVWAAASDASAYGALIKLLLLAGQRRDKVLTMKWADVAADGTWTIATEPREKNNPGSLKLPEAALSIIRAMPRFAGNAYVFSGRGDSHRAFGHHYKEALDKKCGVHNWRLHDLRRCARSLMSRAGVRPDIAERVLGHAVAGVEGIYDRHRYDDEKADALRRLTALIERIVNPPSDKVVPLHATLPLQEAQS